MLVLLFISEGSSDFLLKGRSEDELEKGIFSIDSARIFKRSFSSGSAIAAVVVVLAVVVPADVVDVIVGNAVVDVFEAELAIEFIVGEGGTNPNEV